MKIAISASTNDPGAPMDQRFGRAKYFAVFDNENNEYEYTPNSQNLSFPQGAGIQAARNVIETGAVVLISRNVGPKAFGVLHGAGVEMYLCEGEKSVMEALDAYREGGLTRLDEANAEGHWQTNTFNKRGGGVMCEQCNCGSGGSANEHPLQKEERRFHDEVLKCIDVLSEKIENCRSGAERTGKDKLLSMMITLRSRVENIAKSISSEIERKYRLDPVAEKDMKRIDEIDVNIKSIIADCGKSLGDFSCTSIESLAEFNENINSHMREFEKLYGERAKLLRLYRVYG